MRKHTIIEKRVKELYTRHDDFRIPENILVMCNRLLSIDDKERRWQTFKNYLLLTRLHAEIDNKWAWNLYKETL